MRSVSLSRTVQLSMVREKMQSPPCGFDAVFAWSDSGDVAAATALSEKSSVARAIVVRVFIGKPSNSFENFAAGGFPIATCPLTDGAVQQLFTMNSVRDSAPLPRRPWRS